jgi:hypothetical protein
MEGIFWKDGFEGECRGGLYFRAFDMMKFVNRIQSEGQEIVAIKFDDSNNLEFIVGKMKEEEGNWCDPNPDGGGLAPNEKIDE